MSDPNRLVQIADVDLVQELGTIVTLQLPQLKAPALHQSKPGLSAHEKRLFPPLFQLKITKIPTKIPAMAENAGNLLWYIKMD